MSDEQFLYRFSPEEKAVIDRRFQVYMAAVEVVAELRGLGKLGVPLNADPTNSGFLLPPGVEIKRGAAQQELIKKVEP